MGKSLHIINIGKQKTHIPVKNLFETYPVSRSQAKRMCHRFEKFKEIELDFEGINEIEPAIFHIALNALQCYTK